MIRSEQTGLHSGEGSSGIAGRRILMTADAVGGVWTYSLDVARGLGERGAQTTLAVLGPAPSPEQRDAAATIPGLELVATGLPLDWTAASPAEIFYAGEAIADLARETDADLLHLNSPALAARAPFDLPVIGVCHSCVATWWASMRSAPLPPDFAWRRDLVAQGYAAACALIAPTAAFAQATAEAYGIPAPTVVYNGRPTFHLAGEVEARSAAIEAEPRSHSGFVFTAGRLWDEGKNIALLDRAAARLSVPVLAAGPMEGPNGARIALSRIQPLGRLAPMHVAQHLAAKPVFVSPARYEPFGLAVLEAAQAGCALVLADIPTFRELWEGAALFVAPEDEAALAAALQSVTADDALRRRLGGAASERAGRYSVDSMVEGVLAVYRDILARPAGRPPAALSESLAS
jgi:glycosyltransferase involved in cell wall biosynthesis